MAHPDRYVNHVYGETENGGTSYLIISHMPFKELGLPDVGPTPLNELSEAVMEGTVPFALGWAGVLSALAVGVRTLNKNSKEVSNEATEEIIEPESML